MEIKNISKALLDFQRSVQPIKKNAKAFNYKYAPLEVIQSSIQLDLTKAGLAYSQLPEGENGLLTLLMHPASGEVLTSSYTMKPVKDDPQGRGSCLTYMKRYALTSILGLTIEGEDDDGKVASTYSKVKTNKNVENFMKDLEPTDEEVITWTDKLESARTLKELRDFAKLVPQLVKDKIGIPRFEAIKAKLK